jgi:hypothetical protein
MSSDITLQEAVRIAIDSRLLDVHTALPANVVAYDPITRTATVAPAVRRALEGQTDAVVYETLATIQGVPVLLGAGLVTGDRVLLVFSEADAQMWEAAGGVQDPKDLTRHGLGSPFCVPLTDGVLTIGNPLVAEFVALQSQLVALKTAIDAAASTETSGGGLGGMNALKLALDLPAVSWPTGTLTGPSATLKAAQGSP